MTLVESRIPDDLGDPSIEHRFFGLDKRLIWPTLGVLALVIFWSGVIPAIDESLEGDALESGTVIEMKGGVEFTPADGWNSDGVVLPGRSELTVFKGSVTYSISPGAWAGTADELLDELIDRADPYVKGDRVSQTFPFGEAVGVNIRGEQEEGFLLAIVSGEPFSGADDRVTGIRIEAGSPFEVSEEDQQDIAEMIASIRVVPLDDRTPGNEEDSE